MPRPFRPLPGLLALLATASVALAADGPAYRPAINPRFSAGQLFSFNAEAEYQSLFRTEDHLNKVGDDGANHRTDRVTNYSATHFNVSLVADTALARQVFKNGSLREVVFAVKSCQLVLTKESLASLIPEGATLTVRRQNATQAVFEIDGQLADAVLTSRLVQTDAVQTLVAQGRLFSAHKQPTGEMLYVLDGKIIPEAVVDRIESRDVVQDLLKPGTIVSARKQADGQVAFAVDGAAADTQLSAELSLVVPMGSESGTYDDLLAPAKPMPVGASWDVNLDAVLKSDLPQCFPGLRNVIGQVALKRVETGDDGAPRLVVGATYQLVGLKPPFAKDLTPEPSTAKFLFNSTSPANGGPGTYDSDTTINVRHAAHTGDNTAGFDATEAEFKIAITQKNHFHTNHPPAAQPALAAAPTAPDVGPIPPDLSSAYIYRPPPMWHNKARTGTAGSTGTAASAPALTAATAAAPASSTGAAPTAPTPTAPASATSYTLPQQNSSPFSHAQGP